MNVDLRNITNSFQDVHLVSLSSWRQANEIMPRDRGGPYVVLQRGYDANDTKMIAREFILGRSGKWLAIEYFYRLPVPERREEFIFGRAADVMQMMSELPSKVTMFGTPEPGENAPATAEQDELTAAIQAGKKNQAGGKSG
jgi:hypothetical protein